MSDPVLLPNIWRTQANEILEANWFGGDYRPQSSRGVGWLESLNNQRTRSLSTLELRVRRLQGIVVGGGSYQQKVRINGAVNGCDLLQTRCKRVIRTHGEVMHCGPLFDLQRGGTFNAVSMNHTQDPVYSLAMVCTRLVSMATSYGSAGKASAWERSHLNHPQAGLSIRGLNVRV